jgi:hypothetical protein
MGTGETTKDKGPSTRDGIEQTSDEVVSLLKTALLLSLAVLDPYPQILANPYPISPIPFQNNKITRWLGPRFVYLGLGWFGANACCRGQTAAQLSKQKRLRPAHLFELISTFGPKCVCMDKVVNDTSKER